MKLPASPDIRFVTAMQKDCLMVLIAQRCT